MSRVFRWLIVVAVLAAALIWFYPPARLFALAVAGRSPACPIASAMQSAENVRLQILYKDQILVASKMVEKDAAGNELWDTPAGRYWIPAGSRYVLPFNLAEQKRRIYGNDQQSARAGDIVLDCGANVGVTARVWLAAGAIQVVAIEPAPENLECLRRNFKGEIAAGRVLLANPRRAMSVETLRELIQSQSGSLTTGRT